jgi:hypothetical protein
VWRKACGALLKTLIVAVSRLVRLRSSVTRSAIVRVDGPSSPSPLRKV